MISETIPRATAEDLLLAENIYAVPSSVVCYVVPQ
jgi:hypothetical protein